MCRLPGHNMFVKRCKKSVWINLSLCSLFIQGTYAPMVHVYKAAPPASCSVVVLFEIKGSLAQKEREASKGQVCTRKAQNKRIARPQGPVSQGLQTLLSLHHQSCLPPATCSLLVELGVEDAFTAHTKISANSCSK